MYVHLSSILLYDIVCASTGLYTANTSGKLSCPTLKLGRFGIVIPTISPVVAVKLLKEIIHANANVLCVQHLNILMTHSCTISTGSQKLCRNVIVQYPAVFQPSSSFLPFLESVPSSKCLVRLMGFMRFASQDINARAHMGSKWSRKVRSVRVFYVQRCCTHTPTHSTCVCVRAWGCMYEQHPI